MGGWSRHEPSLDARSHINSLIARGQLRVGDGESAVAKFNEAVISAGELAKKAAKLNKHVLATFAATSELAGLKAEEDRLSEGARFEDQKAPRRGKALPVERDDEGDSELSDEYLDYRFTSTAGGGGDEG